MLGFVTSKKMEPSLSPVLLAMAQAESPSLVLGQVVGAVLERPEVVLARVWFLDDEDCPVCERSGARVTAAPTLHMRASQGRLGAPDQGSNRIDGPNHLVELQSRARVAEVARLGKPVLGASLGAGEDWGLDAASMRAAAVREFVGYPLRFRERVVGVLACYLGAPADASTDGWMQSFAAFAAVAIGNCRAFQEIKRLHRELQVERDYLVEEGGRAGGFGEIVGRSEPLARVLQQVALVAPTEASVLIQGESGTGKELIARAIHQRSPRAGRALVKVNCGSVPKDLFESEFFGHVKGAFTGAVRDRIGRFQLADRGTLFLDEVAEIPLDLQAKLLRVLQEGEFERVGDDATRRVNVRILAATNRDLMSEVAAGRFRADLFYRLSVFPVQVPPLRERREDVPLLAALFVGQACQRLHRPAPELPRQELERLAAYDWPGNIRELQHVVERALILAGKGPVRFGVELSGAPAATPVEARPGRAFYTEEEWRAKERDNIVAAMKEARGRVAGPSGAAALLGVNPNTLTSRLRSLKIRPGSGS